MKKKKPTSPKDELTKLAENAILSNRAMVKLLKIDSEHNALVSDLERHGLELDPLKINLLDVVLDALGVPEDNTAKQAEKFGAHEAYERHDTFCRDWLFEKWHEDFSGTSDEKKIREFLCWIKEQLVIHGQ